MTTTIFIYAAYLLSVLLLSISTAAIIVSLTEKNPFDGSGGTITKMTVISSISLVLLTYFVPVATSSIIWMFISSILGVIVAESNT